MRVLRPAAWLPAVAAGVFGLLLVRRARAATALGSLGVDGSAEVARAEAELSRWKGLTETDAVAAPLLSKYWASVGLGPQPSDVPWSAAFLSYVAAPALSPSSSHVGYARQAWLRRKQGRAGYWAFAPGELGGRLLPGDIVIRSRGEPAGWSDVTNDTGHKDSHGDIVTAVNGLSARLVGGNVSDGVGAKTLSGALPSTVFAVLRKMRGA